MSKSKANKATKEQIEAMFAASEGGDLAGVKQLLAAGVDPNVRNKWNATPLIVAAQKGHEEIFFTLVAAGADLHATRGYGDSVLVKAVISKSPAQLRMVQAIIASGGLGPDDSVDNAFEVACRMANVEVIRALLAAGADPNYEYFPLWAAVRYNRPETVAELIRAGADVNKRIPRAEFDNNKHARKTLLEAANAKGFSEVAKLLEAAGAKLPPRPKRPAEPAPVADSWKRITAWLKINAPDWKPLQKGATEANVAAAEKKLGFALPAELRESYLTYDGNHSAQIFPNQDDISFYLLPLTEAVYDWTMMKELVEKGEFRYRGARTMKCDEGIRKTWWSSRWIPFASNGGGDYFCVDLDPLREGTHGQIIQFRHDSERRKLLAPSLRAFLYELANGLEDGKYHYDEDEGLV